MILCANHTFGVGGGSTEQGRKSRARTKSQARLAVLLVLRKNLGEVGKLISNPSSAARICDECIAVCNAILEDDRPQTRT
jgi:hypothetical protein